MNNIIFFLSSFLVILSCNNKDDNSTSNPIDQLPAITTTGANTAGCLVNGEVLLPKGNNLGSPILQCQYQFVDGNYTFGLGFTDKTDSWFSCDIFTQETTLIQGNTYSLNQHISSSTGGGGVYQIGTGFTNAYFTSSTVTGELTISRLDEINLIISGTFWFDAVNDNGEIVEIREGRFDMHYVP